MYWTYAIVDPRSSHFVYVGQTGDIEKRKRQHLTTHRTKKTKHPPGSIKTWLTAAHKAGLTPIFVILEVLESEEASLLSETAWIEKLGRIAGQPLCNL